jgi:hypothetical protein
MSRPPPLPRQVTQLKIAGWVGLGAGIIQVVIGGIAAAAFRPTSFGPFLLLIAFYVGGGACEAVSALLLLRGRGAALIPFALSCVLLAFFDLSRQLFFLAAVNAVPPLLLVLSASSSSIQSPKPQPGEVAEVPGTREDDIY